MKLAGSVWGGGRGDDNEEGGGGGSQYTTESKSAMCNSVSMEEEEGTEDCDDLLIHGQRWVGGSWIGHYNEAYLEDCTK